MRRTRGGIAYATGGTDGPLLLLLHGLGATGAVWTRLLSEFQDAWPGRWAAPDLRGHGLSLAEAPYGYAVHAADMAELATELGADRVTVLGHSFGGVIGAVLGSGWYGVTVARVVGLGVKIDWTGDEALDSGRAAFRSRWPSHTAPAMATITSTSDTTRLIDRPRSRTLCPRPRLHPAPPSASPGNSCRFTGPLACEAAASRS